MEDEVARLVTDEHLLSTPAAASELSYFLALLRELGGLAELEFQRVALAVGEWVNAGRVPAEHRCVVHNRIATVLIESGDHARAREALSAALDVARTSLEKAYTLAQLGVLEAELGQWPRARDYAGQAAQLAVRADDPAAWLDVRMRSLHVLFRVQHRVWKPDQGAFDDVLRQLTDVCGRQIDRWGNDHPRALEALVITTEAQHAAARTRGEQETMERLVDVLAATAQRSASLLGARHPQAKAARTALLNAHQLTNSTRRDGSRRGVSRWDAERDTIAAATLPQKSVARARKSAQHRSPELKGLRATVTRARVVLWEFDGPICRLFPGDAAGRVTEGLVDWLEERGLDDVLSDRERTTRDPWDILHAVDSWLRDSYVVVELEQRLTQAELRGVRLATPTAYADRLIRAWRTAGVRHAIATDNSPRAVSRYLASHGLSSHFGPHVYGRTDDLRHLKPDPHRLHLALSKMGADPSDALLIGATPFDYRAALAAGIPFLGYARTDQEAKHLGAVGAMVIVNSLEQVLRVVSGKD
ncbi:HAD family hydrolase [Streptomyces sp. NPDC054940]